MIFVNLSMLKLCTSIVNLNVVTGSFNRRSILSPHFDERRKGTLHYSKESQHSMVYKKIMLKC